MKTNLRGTADELVLDRIWLGGDEGKNGGAVGRSDGDEAFAGLELGVVGEVEAELVDVEAEAAVLVADEDLGGVDAEVGGGIRGWCGCGHDGDYTARRSDGRTKKKITRRRRVGDAQTEEDFKEKSRSLAAPG